MSGRGRGCVPFKNSVHSQFIATCRSMAMAVVMIPVAREVPAFLEEGVEPKLHRSGLRWHGADRLG